MNVPILPDSLIFSPLAFKRPRRFGSATDNSNFEDDGTLRMDGDATVFLDSMVPATVFRTGGTSLTFADLHNGIFAHRFDTTDKIHFAVQFNHGIKRTANIEPHVHLVNKAAIVGAADVSFNFVYSWVNIDGTFPDVTPEPKKFSFADTAALSHRVGRFTPIEPTVNQGDISSILIGSLERVHEDYTINNIWLLGFDLHYECDTIGSREMFVK